MNAWWLAARPRTLPVAAAPVVVGGAAAWADDVFRAGPALAALAGALLLQVGANFANDAFDHERGADGPDRLGPPRAAQLGLLSPAALKRGMAVAFAAAVVVGLYLVAVGGWPVVAIGVLAIAAAVAYVGPGAYGYRGLGEPAVFVFFGLVAVGGTYWVQARALPADLLAIAWPVACLATAVLVVNNVRDLESDARAGKRTLAVRLGAERARAGYGALVFAAYGALPVVAFHAASAWPLLPLATAPLATRRVREMSRDVGTALNETLAGTAQLELAFAGLLALGLAA